MKTIGIIGAGNIGKTVAAHLQKAGFPVFISNSKGPDTLKATIALLGCMVQAVTAQEATEADIVLLALPWSKVRMISTLTDWKGKIVIDATNHFTANYDVEDLGGRASSEVIQNQLAGALIVKAFNTLPAKVLAIDPKTANGDRVLFISGNDEGAKLQVTEVIKNIGFAAVDLGSLSEGKLQQAKGALSLLNLIKLY